MEWVWPIFEDYVRNYLRGKGQEHPQAQQLEAAFVEILADTTVTVLVQEPWQTGVRFKGLARYPADEAFALLNDPENYLLAHFGGGKFKLNFHQGLNFIGTKNFKPEGEPKWQHLPDIGY